MKTFLTSDEAKEFLVTQIETEAQREGLPLSQKEKEFLYVSESPLTLPEVLRGYDSFEESPNQQEFDDRIENLACSYCSRSRKTNQEDLKTWKEAVRILKAEEPYLSIVLAAAKGSADSPFVDRLKLFGAALAITLLLCVGIYVYAKMMG